MNRCNHEENVTRLALCKNVLGMEITNGRQGNCKNKIKIHKFTCICKMQPSI